jgi:hypothetical protein
VLAVLLLLAAAAVPAGAQRARILRRAFEPAVTTFLGATGHGDRTEDLLDGAMLDYNNGLALGVQLDRPLTRRTALLGTVSLTPLSRVMFTGNGFTGKLDRAQLFGADAGVAARLKPSAPLFAYVGGGAMMATKRAARDTEGFSVEPRASAGLGLDVARLDKAGVRVMYIAHYVVPGTPDETRWSARSSAFDWTAFIGGRYTLGNWGGPEQ